MYIYNAKREFYEFVHAFEASIDDITLLQSDYARARTHTHTHTQTHSHIQRHIYIYI
jgi:hypothetical protein